MKKLRIDIKTIGLIGLFGLESMAVQGCAGIIENDRIKPLDDAMRFIFGGLEAGARMDRANPYSSNYSGNVYGIR